MREAINLTAAEFDAALSKVCVAVAELPDRTSPEDEPDMMLVTSEELKTIIRNAMQDEYEADYTPGPWIVDDREGHQVRIGYNDQIGNFYGFHEIATMADDNDALDNAALIAMAPNLLHLAKRWSALDGGAWHIDRHAADKAQLLADTRAILARLENGQ